MKKKLEEYVAQNREAFDEFRIDKERLWDRIEKELPQSTTKVIPLWRRTRWQVAVSIVLIIGGGMFFTNRMNDPFANQELQEVDNYYGTLINRQVTLIKNNPNLTEKERADFLLLIDDLDAEYAKLKLELKEGINDKKIMQAIINNYRKKIQLMENLMNKSYPSKKEEDDEKAYIL